jgi:hypothetical protein
MERSFVRRRVSSGLTLLVLGAAVAASVGACSASDPPLPTSSNPVIETSVMPPPISGGTLLVTEDGLAVAADSERDVVYVVDLGTQRITTIPLQKGDEPGRVIETGAGIIHVALRRAGAVARIDLSSSKVTRSQTLCSAPRGLAYDTAGASPVVHLACAGGEVVTFDATTDQVVGAPVRIAERDLRDVVMQDGKLLISRFRSGDLLTLDPSGQVVARTNTAGVVAPNFAPTLAWRTIPAPSGGVFILHQVATSGPVVISQPGGYGSGSGMDPNCNGTIVQTTLSHLGSNGQRLGGTVPTLITGASVPVDVASDGSEQLLIVSAGSDAVFTAFANALEQGGGACTAAPGPNNLGTMLTLPGQPVAAAARAQGQFVVQIREMTPGKGQGPALILTDGANSITGTIALPGASMANTGHSLFHHNASPSSPLACASCHGEGHDDGHVWVFDTLGSRRTQTVSGGVLATAPLHWNGDMSGLTDIMHEVFEKRMSGDPAQAGPRHIEAFANWLDTIPAYPASPTGSATQIAHGKELFESAKVGCTTCHNGAHFTNNQTVDVGTSQAFQVPTLIGVAARAPFMHDGCAATLADRFDPTQPQCNGGDNHGKTSQLSNEDRADLVAYLETL